MMPSVLCLLIVAAVAESVGAAAGSQEDSDLSTSLRCSACEVVSKVVFNYSRSLNFAAPPRDGLARLAEAECTQLRIRFKLAQQAFAAHLKVFIPRDAAFDMIRYEPAEFYSDEEHQLARGSMDGLVAVCARLLLTENTAAEAALAELAASEEVTDDFFSKRFCRVLTNDCADDVLKAERTKVLAQRRIWKKMSKQHRRDQTISRSLRDADL